MTELGPWERAEGLDEYRPDHGIIGQVRGCTFCGSMEPGDFLEAVKDGAEIGPTDKSYKLYVQQPNPDPDRLHPMSGSHSASPHSTLTELRWEDMTEEQAAEARRVFGGGDDGPHYEWIGFGTRPHIDSKFYTQHLSPEQGREFYELWQTGRVRWGYPGGPYRPLYLPGLVDAAPKEEEH
jgi:hypothetical protein